MNYYQYKRRAPRSAGSDYLKPFLVIILFIGVVVAGWRLLASFSSDDQLSVSNEKVFLNIETGSAKAMTSGSNEWKSVPSSIYLYEGEKIKTQSDGRVTLNFFETDVLRMEKSTELEFTRLRKSESENESGVTLVDGKIWVSLNPSQNPPSKFTVETDLITLTAVSGIFAVSAPGTIHVMEGSVQANIHHAGDIVKTTTIGVGQELMVDQEMAADLSEGLDREIIFALDDNFKNSAWYRWNQEQDGTVDTTLNEENSEENSSPEDAEESDAISGEDSEKTVSIEGDKIVDDKDDKQAPEAPKILEPGSNGQTVTLKEVEQVISGTVSADTEAVIVNDYRLNQYVSGSGKFSYFAKVSYKNLAVGDNEYEVIAVDKAGNKSEAAKIILILPQAVYDKASVEEEMVEKTDVPASSTSGGVKITAPNKGENLVTKETSFEILGTIPEDTAKVTVNDYQLQAFKKGDETFKYNAKVSLGTLKIGSNTYTVKAFSETGDVLGTASMTIELEAAETDAFAPIITIPTATEVYETTLDQITIGGKVGKSIESVYLNDVKMNDYVIGSGEWKMTVTLIPGENIFSVHGISSGQKTETDTLKINYQN